MIHSAPPASATDITDKDFWSSLRIPPRCPAKDTLKQSMAHGHAGRRAKAYTALAAYHRTALAEEWAYRQEEAAKQQPPDPEQLKQTLNHNIPCWHNQVIQFGKVIDWNPPGLASTGGWHYFGFFRPVVTAYIQNNAKDCETFIKDILIQYKAYETGANWTADYKRIVFNQLGASSKLESWLPAYLALINRDALTTGVADSVMKHFLGFGRALYAYNREFIPHNITTHGARALLGLARLFPEFKESTAWNRRATQRIYEQAVKGFRRDGGHYERVWGYGSHTLKSVGEAYRLAQRHGGLGDLDRPMLKSIRQAYRFFAKTLGPAPEYRQPTYGDSGQGSMQNILNEGRSFFPRGTDENLGVDRTRSYLLRDSGFAIMRNGNDKNSVYLNLSFGMFAGWHSHQDLLSMNLWAYGQPLLEEVGRFGPYEMPLDTLFRAPESHNLLTIDGAVYNGQGIQGEDVQWHTSEEVDYFSATHWAYAYYCYGREGRTGTSPNIEGKVRRTIVFVKDPGYVVVLDSVLKRLPDRPFAKAVTQNWHSPTAFKQWGPARAATGGRVGCVLAYARQEGLARLETGSDFTEAEGREWGNAHSRYQLRARRWMPLGYEGTVGFATLLFPYRGKRPEVSIRARPAAIDDQWRTETFEILTPAGKDVITVNPEKRATLGKGQPATDRAIVQRGGPRKRIVI